MKKNLSLTLALVVLGFATGCQQSTTSELDQEGFRVEQPSFATYMAPNSSSDGQGRVIAEQLYGVAVKPMRDLQNQYEAGAISADKLHEEAQGIIAKSSDDENLASLVAQTVSHRTLSILIGDEDASEHAIAWHTDVLIKYKSPHADVISDALVALDGHWSDAQIKAASDETVVNAEAWLGSTDDRMHAQGEGRTAISTAVKNLAE